VGLQLGRVRVLGVLAVDYQIGVEPVGQGVAPLKRFGVVWAGVEGVDRQRRDRGALDRLGRCLDAVEVRGPQMEFDASNSQKIWVYSALVGQ